MASRRAASVRGVVGRRFPVLSSSCVALSCEGLMAVDGHAQQPAVR